MYPVIPAVGTDLVIPEGSSILFLSTSRCEILSETVKVQSGAIFNGKLKEAQPDNVSYFWRRPHGAASAKDLGCCKAFQTDEAFDEL